MRTHGLLLLAIGAPLWAQVSGNATAYSPEKEAALGKQLAAEIRRQNTVIENPSVQQYLNRLGQKLAAQMPDLRSSFTFSTVADDRCPATHEPLSVPGRYVFVPAGLFLAAQDESEFGGMLAHALAHIALRRGMREVARARVDNGATIPLIFMGGMSCSAFMPLTFRTAQRSYELEADALAIQTVARAGFDPRALVRYIERVQNRPAGARSKAGLTALDRDGRIAALLSAIEQLGRFDLASGSPNEFATARNEVRDQMRSVSEPQKQPDTPPSLLRPRPQ